MIVKFKSHGFRERLYRDRRKIPLNNKIKFRVSLTKRRSKLLEETIKICKDATNIDFVFSDSNGNLKIKLVSRANGKLFFDFNSEEDLSEVLALADDRQVNTASTEPYSDFEQD